MWKEYLFRDDSGDLWVICSPNKGHAAARYTDATGRKLLERDVRELTPKDEQMFASAVSTARRHHNMLIFAGNA